MNECLSAFYQSTNRHFYMYVPFLWQVQPKHVKEAFRLLNKSIIRVETPDVQFDEDEEEQQEGRFGWSKNLF